MSDERKAEAGFAGAPLLGVPFKLKKQARPLEPEGWVVVNSEGEELAGLFEEKWEAWRWIAEEYFAAMTPELLKDKARLDWLEQGTNETINSPSDFVDWSKGRITRATIDAAMSPPNDQGEPQPPERGSRRSL